MTAPVVPAPAAHARRALLAAVLALLLILVAAPSARGAASSVTGQVVNTSPSSAPDGQIDGRLRVFLDCSACDFDFLRTEITYLDYVRDPADAQVHVLVTTLPTGGGGTEYTMRFIGRQEFAGIDDQIRFSTPQMATADEVRREIARRLQLGLMRYIARMPLATQITVVQDLEAPPGTPRTDDPWNHWVFRSRVSANMNSEESIGSKTVFGSFSADRTTEAWKFLFGVSGSYNESRFDLSETRFTNTTRTFDATGLVVGSLGPHWSWAFGGSATISTFVNQDLTVRVAPALQYNVFPYEEATRRVLTISYAVGTTAFDYEEVTIFGRTSEVLTDETLTVSLGLKQPWGQSEVALEASHFFADPRQHRVVLAGSVDFRVYRGLSFNVSGSASRIRDQVFLPGAGLTDEEILVQRRQLATDHRYSISFGVAFTFGSPYNNVVNPRFAGSSGGVFRTF